MRLLCMGDLHYRATAPRSRKDDYVQTLFGKVEQIRRIAREEGCSFILQPGDFFDSSTPPLWLIREVIVNTTPGDVPWLVVFGQHDQRYHSNRTENTPIGVLEAAQVVRVLGNNRYTVPNPSTKSKGISQGNPPATVTFYGAGWSEAIPDPIKGTPHSPKVNVLLTHRMVVREKLWHDQTDFTYGVQLLRSTPYDLIVTGDNHKFFTETVPGKDGPRHLINCGSLMRTNSDQREHVPTVVLYDTDIRKITPKPLQVSPPEEVFLDEPSVHERARSADMEAFVELIKGRTAPDLDFLKVLRDLTGEKDVPDGVSQVVKEILEMSHV